MTAELDDEKLVMSCKMQATGIRWLARYGLLEQ